MGQFVLDARLEADTLRVGTLDLSLVLLMNDRRWPWLILVPQRADAIEILDLCASDRAQLMEDAALAGRALKAAGPSDKLNLGALGNKVRQLHLHVLARRDGDTAWPGPVWGVGTAEPYEMTEAQDLIATLRQAMRLS